MNAVSAFLQMAFALENDNRPNCIKSRFMFFFNFSNAVAMVSYHKEKSENGKEKNGAKIEKGLVFPV